MPVTPQEIISRDNPAISDLLPGWEEKIDKQLRMDFSGENTVKVALGNPGPCASLVSVLTLIYKEKGWDITHSYTNGIKYLNMTPKHKVVTLGGSPASIPLEKEGKKEPEKKPAFERQMSLDE